MRKAMKVITSEGYRLVDLGLNCWMVEAYKDRPPCCTAADIVELSGRKFIEPTGKVELKWVGVPMFFYEAYAE